MSSNRTNPTLRCGGCLGEWEPASMPCGHLACSACLAKRIKAELTFDEVKCPRCRAPFSVLTPDLQYVPKDIQQFILPSIRRVYVTFDFPQRDEDPEMKRIKAALHKSEVRNAHLTSEHEILTMNVDMLEDRHGRLVDDVEYAQIAEEEETEEADKAKADMEKLQKKFDHLAARYGMKLIEQSNITEALFSEADEGEEYFPQSSGSQEDLPDMGLPFPQRIVRPLPRRVSIRAELVNELSGIGESEI